MNGKRFTLAGGENPVQIYLDPADTGYQGIRLAAEAFAEDVFLVTGKRPELVTEVSGLHGTVLVVGTMLQNPLIREAVERGDWSLAEIEGKWECYSTRLMDCGLNGVTECLMIAGSDKRGCIYGIYRLSELIGVSPWVWFADVVPETKETLILRQDEVEFTSKEPSVKYRGIFINDESPSFTGWAYGKFGGLNDKMYRHVFELILRLKGNYLWPAMWGNVFSEEGSEHPQDNIRMADEYGIVMGTSHHEPMCRAGEEWRHLWQNYTDRYNWDFAVNREGITRFWKDGIHRNKPYESVITIGMRGEADSALEGGLKYNIDLLKDIILTQKELLAADGLADAPKMLVVYKEVEKYWNGDSVSEGLKNWRLPDGTSPLDDVVIMLCEDNYGNVRSLPVTEQLKNRKGGWGMYYHFDYNGGPRGYMWLNVMQLEKTWEQLSETYDCGVRDIWIVNVGDLKPMELQISYYMDLAYDFDTYGTGGSVTPGEYYLQFAKQQFAYGVTEETQAQIAAVLAGYSKLNAICKPEYMREHIYSIRNFGEASRMLGKALCLMEEAEDLRTKIPAKLQDAFEQLVYYPAVASANVVALYIYSAYNRYYAEKKDARANGFAALVEEAIEKDKALAKHYNEEMSGGKWRKMMSQPHLGYVSWNAEHCAPPVPVIVEGADCNMTTNALVNEILNAEIRPVEGITVLQADRFTKNEAMVLADGEKAQFQVIPDYGRHDASVKVYPVTMEPAKRYDRTGKVEGLPYLEYEFTADRAGEYKVQVTLAPSNHLDGDKVELRYGLFLDDKTELVINALPKGYVAGDCYEPQWCHAVEINAHICESRVTLEEGAHRLCFYGIDAGLVLQKIVIYRGELPYSYLGPEGGTEQ
ncbi:MAG: glycosyl hydrolase 115 family protein [Lachnospiraceae bacterium]